MSHHTILPPSTVLRLKFCADYSRSHIALLAVVPKWQSYHKSYRWETNDVQFWWKLSGGMVLLQPCAVFLGSCFNIHIQACQWDSDFSPSSYPRLLFLVWNMLSYFGHCLSWHFFFCFFYWHTGNLPPNFLFFHSLSQTQNSDYESLQCL